MPLVNFAGGQERELQNVEERAVFGDSEPAPRVLLSLPEKLGRSDLARRLRVGGHVDVVEVDSSLAGRSKGLRPQPLDVAVVHAQSLQPNFAALLHDPGFGAPEIVFAVDSDCPAQRLALLSHGYRHVVSGDRLASWLPEQLPALWRLARARRIVLAACAANTTPAEFTLGKAGRRMHLHSAETVFRETFLRALLTEHGSRRKAAEAAGVPYRSFCEMLRKLDI